MPSGKKRTHEEFVEQLTIQNPNSKDFVVLDKYVSNVSKIRCQCKLCGEIWITTPKQLIDNKQRCPNCSKYNRKISHEEFVERVKINNPYFDKFIFLSKFDGFGKPIRLKCKECGHIWETRPFDLSKKGTNCPSCSGNATSTDAAFKLKFFSKNPNASSIELLSEYKGSMNRIDCKCKICGHQWSPLATSLLQGSGCPTCAKKRIAISNTQYLEKTRGSNPASTPMTHEEFLEKFYKVNPHKDDIEILSKYTKSKNNIKCKCKRCGFIWETKPTTLLNKSGCPSCAHTSTSFMEQFVLFSFRDIFGKDKVITRDKKVIGKELDIYVPIYNFAVEIGSWKWHKETFKDDLNKIDLCKSKGIRLFTIYDVCDLDIHINDIYTFSFDLSFEQDYKSLKALVQSISSIFIKKYDFGSIDWKKIEKEAYTHSQRIDFQAFIERFKDSNDDYENIEIIGPYTKLSSKIKCRCKRCGHIWEPIAFDLLRNSGCIKCRMKDVGVSRRKAAIISEWRKKHPNGNKRQCHLDTGIAYVTVLKWWDGEQ